MLGLVSCAGPRLIERPAAVKETAALSAQMYARLWQRNQAVNTVKGSAEIRVSRHIFSRAAMQAIVLRRPDNLRIDSFSPFGDLIHQLIYHEGWFGVFEPGSGSRREGADVNRLLREEFQLDLAIKDVIELLSGAVPLEIQENYLAVRRGDTIILRGLRSQVVIDAHSFLPMRYMAYSISEALYEVSFEDYRNLSGMEFPYRIVFRLNDPRLKLAIDFEDVVLNEELQDEIFQWGNREQ